MIALMGAFWTTHDESRPGQHSFDSRQLPHDTWFTCVVKRNKVRTPKINAGCDDIVDGRRRWALNCTTSAVAKQHKPRGVCPTRAVSLIVRTSQTLHEQEGRHARAQLQYWARRLSVIFEHGRKKKGLYHPTPTSTLPYFAFDTCFKRF